ncbi:MAG: hypothetical protein V1827_04610 [Candidatus Micrarchaeota archaeon]
MRRKKAGKDGDDKPDGGASEKMSQYFFTFEVVKQYPTVRSFIMKAPLKRSFGDSFMELVGGSKKGAYKI